MTSNGVLLADMAAELKKCGLDRLNISLDTLDREKYRRITRVGDIELVLAGIERSLAAGFAGTKINMVLIPGFNDVEVPGMMAFCRASGMQLQRIHHYHLDHPWQASTLPPAERPLSCHVCNRIRLTADGQLKPCLFSDLELPVDFSDIAASIRAAIGRKPPAGSVCTSRQNWQIGG
jgi:cyclic pyranopterin phosphate synthase